MDHLFNDLWSLAQQASPFAVCLLLYLWYGEHAERQALAKELKDLCADGACASQKASESLMQVQGTLRDLQIILQTQRATHDLSKQ